MREQLRKQGNGNSHADRGTRAMPRGRELNPMQGARFDPVAETYDSWCETPLDPLRRAGGLLRPSLYSSARFSSRRRLSALLRDHGFLHQEWRAAVFYPPVAAAWSHAVLRAMEAAGQQGVGFGPAFLAVRATGA